METPLHRGDVTDYAQQIRNNQADIARLHLIHDFGDAGAKRLFELVKPDALIQGVLEQRASMMVKGTLMRVNEEGKHELVGKIDLGAFGLTNDDLVGLSEPSAVTKSWPEIMEAVSSPARLDAVLSSHDPVDRHLMTHPHALDGLRVRQPVAPREAVQPTSIKPEDIDRGSDDHSLGR